MAIGTYFCNSFTKISALHRAKFSRAVSSNKITATDTETRRMFLSQLKTFARTIFRFAGGTIKTLKDFATSFTFNISHILNYSISVNDFKPLKVYNLEVEDQHEYFANGALVHNCNYCVSIDSRIVEKDDSFAQNDLFHSSCRGMWVEILTDEVEKPPIGGIPNSLRERFGGTVNRLIQPQKPIVDKDSVASQFLK